MPILTRPDLFREAAYFGGGWHVADSETFDEIRNPATGEILGRVPRLGAAETERAIAAAEAALPAWRGLPAKERSKILRRWFDLIIANQEDLATILTLEQGKPLREARGEIAYGASFIEWYAEEAKRVNGDVLQGHAADKRILVLKQAIGVTAAITPWNFPNAMITRKAGPALAAGCTMVLKPAPSTPFSALALAVLAEEAGIPAGVFQVLPGDAIAIGGAMLQSPVVRKITFTGSTAVGKLLLKGAADTVKKCSMELGGNSPLIVFDDADIDLAIAGAIASKFRNAGQTCVCANRILVQSGIHDEFVARLTQAIDQFHIGNGLDPATDIGPLINQAAMDKVADHVADALNHGGTLIRGGKALSDLGAQFYAPTLITGINRQAKVLREETFGPLAAVLKFETEAEAIQIANDTEFGLAAYLFSRDLNRVIRVAEQIETGIVGINDGIISTEMAPFGGIKQSGLGSEGSAYGIQDYLELKYLCIGNVK